MPRQVGVTIENNFSKGLITEASGMNFPENSCTTTVNCVHRPTGNVKRRMGFDFEVNNSTKNISKTAGVIASYLWKDVAGDGTQSLFVMQVRNLLHFYNASTTEPLSSTPITDVVNLNTYKSDPSGPDPLTRECQFASGNGKLFVTHPFLNPIAIEFDDNTETFTVTEITIEIRDFEGMDDGLAVDFRPLGNKSSLSVAHYYNLLNQGWEDAKLDTWDSALLDMPSNVDVMWRFKDVVTDNFDPTVRNRVILGNSPSPKGHYVLEAFRKDREEASGLTIPVEYTYQRPSTISFFAGRLFYSGINATGYNSKIYFSQVIEEDTQFGKAYQTNDPTSENMFDLLPTDGGVIDIQEAGTIFKTSTVPGGLAVFASNGVWLLSGSTGIGFTANDYTVTKISAITTVSHTSFIDLAGSPVWWNIEGIYRLDGSGGQGFQVTSLSETTIKSFYDTIPPSEKRNARGFFNPLAGMVQWVFRSTESGNLEEYYEYDRVLNLDITTGGFYVWTLPEHEVTVHGLVVIENRGGEVALEDVTDGGITVTDSGDDVTVWTISDSLVTPRFKFIVSYVDSGEQFTFAEARRDDYVDWELIGVGVNYISTFITGYKLRGNAMTNFQSNYVTFYSDNNSEYSVQGVWDYSNTPNSGRWSMPQLIEAQDDDQLDVRIARRKIRGMGKSLQLKITSSTGEPFNVIGWSMLTAANQTP